MMKMLGTPVLALLLFVVPSARAADAAKPAAVKDEPVAFIGQTPITQSQLQEKAEAQLRQLRNQEYDIRSRVLDEMISQRLLEQEAKVRGLSAAELTRLEIDGKAKPVTEADKSARFEREKTRIPQGMTEAAAREQIEKGMVQERMYERRAEFLKELRSKAGVRVLLEAPRTAVELGRYPAKGPENAPVTIVEFSDFQCPYCSRVTPTLKQLQEKYADKIRIAFRDYPLPMHPQAPKAAEAAACAQDQGKFWEMHDRLFGNQNKLQVADLKQHAAELGLDAAQFGECLDSGKHTAGWKQDMEAGNRYGVSGTPAFFINGRFLSGAQPFESFSRVIDEELSRPTPPAKDAKGKGRS